MKNTIYVFLLLFSTTFALAQSRTSTKIGNELKEKIQSTPVGFIKKGKSTVNLKALNPKTCAGEKINSFKIVKSKKLNNSFLIRRAKLKNGFFTSIIQLRTSGGNLFVNLNAENFMAGCYSTTCQSCGEALSQTGMAFCECESTGGDCEEYDHCPDSEVIGSLFL